MLIDAVAVGGGSVKEIMILVGLVKAMVMK